MSDMTDYTETALVDHLMSEGVRALTSPAVLALKLHVGSPTDSGAANEVPNTNNYSRQAMAFAAASSGVTATSDSQVFTATGGNWGAVDYISIADSLTHGAGNNLVWGGMTTNRTVNDGDTLTFAIAAITVTFA